MEPVPLLHHLLYALPFSPDIRSGVFPAKEQYPGRQEDMYHLEAFVQNSRQSQFPAMALCCNRTFPGNRQNYDVLHIVLHQGGHGEEGIFRIRHMQKMDQGDKVVHD